MYSCGLGRIFLQFAVFLRQVVFLSSVLLVGLLNHKLSHKDVFLNHEDINSSAIKMLLTIPCKIAKALMIFS